MQQTIVFTPAGKPVNVIRIEREDVEDIKPGSKMFDCFGQLQLVTSVFAKGRDCHGKHFACFYAESGSDGSTMSNSIKEGEIMRTVPLCNAFTSAKIDELERLLNK